MRTNRPIQGQDPLVWGERPMLCSARRWPEWLAGLGVAACGPQQAMARSNDIRVLFVKTAETEWERSGRIAGSTDVPLTAEGWESMLQAMENVQGARLSTVLCGPDEGSQGIARELANRAGCKVKVIEDLGEVHLGLWEGMLGSDLQEKCPTTYRQWMEDPGVVSVPEGEALEDAQARLLEALRRNMSRIRGDSGAVGVVLRPMALGLVSCALTGVPMKRLWSMIEAAPLVEWRTVGRGGLEAAAKSRTGVGA